MKANKLMIGDVVSVNYTPLQIAALGTAKAGFLDARGEMFYHYYDNINGIELTDEILKNNITGDEDGYYLCVKAMSGEIVIVKQSDNNFYLAARCYNDGKYILVGGTETRLRYVHELQHALRLCGIEKEIVL